MYPVSSGPPLETHRVNFSVTPSLVTPTRSDLYRLLMPSLSGSCPGGSSGSCLAICAHFCHGHMRTVTSAFLGSDTGSQTKDLHPSFSSPTLLTPLRQWQRCHAFPATQMAYRWQVTEVNFEPPHNSLIMEVTESKVAGGQGLRNRGPGLGSTWPLTALRSSGEGTPMSRGRRWVWVAQV